MTNSKALAVTEREALSTTVFENPELTAMAAICELLQELPDDAARMRVMYWSFGRFSHEFKRPAPAPAPLAPGATTVPAPLPTAADVTPRAEDADFGSQISELRDLFPSDRPLRGAAFADAF